MKMKEEYTIEDFVDFVIKSIHENKIKFGDQQTVSIRSSECSFKVFVRVYSGMPIQIGYGEIEESKRVVISSDKHFSILKDYGAITVTKTGTKGIEWYRKRATLTTRLCSFNELKEKLMLHALGEI